jgi:hypothetical protein
MHIISPEKINKLQPDLKLSLKSYLKASGVVYDSSVGLDPTDLWNIICYVSESSRTQITLHYDPDKKMFIFSPLGFLDVREYVLLDALWYGLLNMLARFNNFASYKK